MEKWSTLRDLVVMYDSAATPDERREIESVMVANWSPRVVRRSVRVYEKMKKSGYKKPKRITNRELCASYFVSCELPSGEAFVKIGEIRNIALVCTLKGAAMCRFKSLQCGNPIPLTLIGMSEAEEPALHAMWSSLRHTGEWFRKTSEFEAWMSEHVIPWSEILTWGERSMFRKQAAVFRASSSNRNVKETP